MGLFPFMSSTYGKPLYAKVTTMDADLDRISIEPDWSGRQLFDTVCRIIGLREIWFFGLQFNNKKNIPCWLQMDKKVMKQDVSRSEDGTLQFLFLVKFYPEDVEEELIQDLTRHLFFVQLKEAIVAMELYCSAEASVLLASYAVQAMYGDCNDEVDLELQRLMPLNVIQSFDMTADMWTERIRRWWANNQGQSREEAQMEYLRVAQDLDMYGIQYYPICNKKETDLHLGVSAQGIGIYKEENRMAPRPFFSWNEIKSIQFKNKKFSMKTMDKSEITFRAQDASINMSILDLCIGTHNLYLRRRQADILEVQQMRAQSKEQRIRRQAEQARLAAEREERLAVETERNQLKTQLEIMREQLVSTQEAVRKTEETAELLAEKARASENNAMLLSKRVSEAEAECQRFKISHRKEEEARIRSDRKAAEMEVYAARLLTLGDCHRRPLYASHAMLAEAGWGAAPLPLPLQGTLSYHQLMLSSSSQEETLLPPHNNFRQSTFKSQDGGPPILMPSLPQAPPPLPSTQAPPPLMQAPPPDPSAVARGEMMPPDLRTLRADLEMSRKEYNERTRSFKEKLADFRAEIEGLKRDDRRPTDHDMQHAANVAHGFDKFSTLRMMKSKSSSSIGSLGGREW